jgi:tetratricopeptide (TPR) repeat protein
MYVRNVRKDERKKERIRWHLRIFFFLGTALFFILSTILYVCIVHVYQNAEPPSEESSIVYVYEEENYRFRYDVREFVRQESQFRSDRIGLHLTIAGIVMGALALVGPLMAYYGRKEVQQELEKTEDKFDSIEEYVEYCEERLYDLEGRFHETQQAKLKANSRSLGRQRNPRDNSEAFDLNINELPKNGQKAWLQIEFGNEAFDAEEPNYDKAMMHYHNAIEFLEPLYDNSDDEKREKLKYIYAISWSNLARCLWWKGEYYDSLMAIGEALTLIKKPRFYYQRGVAFAELRAYGDAFYNVTKAIHEEKRISHRPPAQRNSILARYYSGLATLLAGWGRLDEAKKADDEAVRLCSKAIELAPAEKKAELKLLLAKFIASREETVKAIAQRDASAQI